MPLPIELWLIHPKLEMCDAFDHRFANLPNFKVIQSRFEDLPPHDCFVTAGNSFGIMNAGIDAAVIRVHGEAFMNRVQFRILNEYLGEQPIGSSMILETDDSAFPYIAHSPTMRVPGSISKTDKVYTATWGTLIEIYRHNVSVRQNTSTHHSISTVAFPALGAGFGGVAYDEVARQMAAAYRHYLHPPSQMNWETVTQRELAIAYDQGRKIIR